MSSIRPNTCWRPRSRGRSARTAPAPERAAEGNGAGPGLLRLGQPFLPHLLEGGPGLAIRKPRTQRRELVDQFAQGLRITHDLGHVDIGDRKAAADNVALLTPIVKAFLTDNAFECTNHGVQVFGGHGFITDNGMEQYVRDARITQLYEGTNGVQALDLLGRKVLGDMGAKLRAFGAIVQKFVEDNGVDPKMQEFVNPLADIGDKVQKLTMEIGMKAMQNQDEVGAASVPYQRVVGHMVFSYFWARMAQIALAKQEQDDFYKAKLATARFYFAKLLPETAGYIRQARAGVASLYEMQDDWF